MSRSLRINTLYSKIVPDSPGRRASRRDAEAQRAAVLRTAWRRGLGVEVQEGNLPEGNLGL
jgi:hypothetical protein